jgi:hypothetical protein
MRRTTSGYRYFTFEMLQDIAACCYRHRWFTFAELCVWAPAMTVCGTAPSRYRRRGASECAGERSSNLTLSRKEWAGFSGRSGLNLFSFDEHAFTEIQAFPLSHAPVEGKPDLAHLNGELA